MTQLQHIFANGIRFDTQVQHLVVQSHGRRYRNLPCLHPVFAHPRQHGLLCLTQCLAVLCQMHFDRAIALVQEWGVRDVLQLVQCQQLRVQENELRLNYVASDQAKRIGAASRVAIQQEQMCMVNFSTATASRWATVVGVEMESATGHVRTLLLLEPQACAPWACGHNARLELDSVAGKAAHASAGYTLNYRYLTGDACAVKLNGLVTISSSGVTG